MGILVGEIHDHNWFTIHKNFISGVEDLKLRYTFKFGENCEKIIEKFSEAQYIYTEY